MHFCFQLYDYTLIPYLLMLAGFLCGSCVSGTGVTALLNKCEDSGPANVTLIVFLGNPCSSCSQCKDNVYPSAKLKCEVHSCNHKLYFDIEFGVLHVLFACIVSWSVGISVSVSTYIQVILDTLALARCLRGGWAGQGLAKLGHIFSSTANYGCVVYRHQPIKEVPSVRPNEFKIYALVI